MNHGHAQISNHMPHGTHQHSNIIQEESSIFRHNHLNTSDHDSMMKMYSLESELRHVFHTGFSETILFELWTTTSIPLFIGSWILIFIVGVLYEGIREIRQYLEKGQLLKKPIISNDGTETELERINTESPESTLPVKKEIPLRHTEGVLQSILYTIHLALGYILMFIVTTANVYLFLAIIFGIGTGYLLYTWSRIKPSISKNERHT